jgi:hypothetical protein
MRGFITTRHLVTHARLIIQQFGWRVYLRCVLYCLRPGKPVTFLSIACAPSA